MADAVAWAARSLPNRPPVPILKGLMIDASDAQVTFSSFDYERSSKVTVAGEILEPGQALVNGSLLAEIARSLPVGTVEFTADAQQAELVCGPARFTLQMLPVADYPKLPDMPESVGTVSADEFARSVAQVFVAAGRDELLPVFTGVRVEIDGERLSLLATDRYRMALKELTWSPSSPSAETAALVPAKVLNDTARSMTAGDTVTLSLADPAAGEGLIGFEGQGTGGERQITTRLLDGEFPKVRHLMNVDASVTVRAKTDEIVAAVKRVALVAERNTPLRMLIGDDQLSLEAATTDQAQASEAIPAVVTHEKDDPQAITAAGFNHHYLSDALGALDTPYVHFAFTGPGKPCLITGLPDADGDPDPSYKHVIMLMRLPS